jgi:hypothetical protein
MQFYLHQGAGVSRGQMHAPCIEGGAGIQVSRETKPDQVFIL